MSCFCCFLIFLLFPGPFLCAPHPGSNPGDNNKNPGADPECYMTTLQLIENAGFAGESHYVTTPDGYILNIFRIPPKPRVNGGDQTSNYSNGGDDDTARAPVVFFQHGLIASSDCWILNDRWGSWPFLAADAGYDVWLGNVRGNVYCLNHTHIPVSSEKFWDFSFQEMAEQDLPAMVDFVLESSKQEKLFYIAHSQGTEMGFVEFSQNPELADKVHLFVALAPIARISYAKGLMGLFSNFNFLLNPLYELFGNQQFAAPSYTYKFYATMVCPIAAIVQDLCETLDELISGFDISNINQTRYEIYKAHADQSTSTKDIVHWAQLIKAKEVQKFDYEDPEVNMKHYNQTTPPTYNISNVKVPTVLVSGGSDWLSDTRDVMWLVKTMEPYIRHVIFIDKYNHDDYTTGINAPELVYHPVMEMMSEVVRQYHADRVARQQYHADRVARQQYHADSVARQQYHADSVARQQIQQEEMGRSVMRQFWNRITEIVDK